MKYIKQLLLVAVVIVGIFAVFSLLNAQPLLADAKDDVCTGVEFTGGSCDPPGRGQPTVQNTIRTVINILSFVVGVVAVIMVIVGGFKYITSGGDSNSVNSAKNTILYALVGLIIVALSQVIVRFVLNEVT